MVQREEQNTTPVAYFPKMYKLNLIMREHQTNPNKEHSTEYLTCTLQNFQGNRRQRLNFRLRKIKET